VHLVPDVLVEVLGDPGCGVPELVMLTNHKPIVAGVAAQGFGGSMAGRAGSGLQAGASRGYYQPPPVGQRLGREAGHGRYPHH